MAKKYAIVSDEEGELLMAPGFQSNVDAWFDQNPYQGELRRFNAEGVTTLVVRDVRDSAAKNTAINQANASLKAAGLPTYSDLIATIEALAEASL